MKNAFTTALEAGDREALRQEAKSDLHSHAGRGGHPGYIAEWAGVTIPAPPARFQDLADMQAWFDAEVKVYCPGLAGQLKRWEAAFAQAKHDHIEVLSMSFTSEEVKGVGGMEAFTSILKELRTQFAPDTCFLPELTFDRANDPAVALDVLEEMIPYGFFHSIDLCCDELAQPAAHFKQLYRRAREAGLLCRAHVGEFGTADDVMEAVEVLALDEVHHGIAAGNSPFAMQYLSTHGIVLNVCPTSNVMLGRAESYATHPIRALYDHGVRVTVNTDDLLIFGQSVSDEYWNLYTSGCCTAAQLGEIRTWGLAGAKQYT